MAVSPAETLHGVKCNVTSVFFTVLRQKKEEMGGRERRGEELFDSCAESSITPTFSESLKSVWALLLEQEQNESKIVHF